MNLDDLTFRQIREIAQLFNSAVPAAGHKEANPFADLVGKNIQVRTVTMIYVGRLEAVYSQELVLNDAAWIPDTGRYQQFIEKGVLDECEPYPDGQPVIIGRGALIDATEWRSRLPRMQK